MDVEREHLQAYEYLCHVGEAKDWLEFLLPPTQVPLPPIVSLAESLRNGIALAHVARRLSPEVVGRVYEDTSRLHFRHSDNINFFFASCRKMGLPEIFVFELTDLYDLKNFPKVVYCIHALSHLLAKRGIAPRIKNLVGQLQFTADELSETTTAIAANSVPLPSFGTVESSLAKELSSAAPVETEEEKRRRWFNEREDSVVKVQAAARGWKGRMAAAQVREEKRRVEEKRRKEEEERKRREEEERIRLEEEVRRREEEAREKERLRRESAERARLRAERERQLWFSVNEHRIAQVQAIQRGRMARRNYWEMLERLARCEPQAIILQSWWKGVKARRAYQGLKNIDNPSVEALHTFAGLVDDTSADFDEELELERLRQLIILRIRENAHLESEVNELDVKISLLVRNRISLDDVLARRNKKAAKSLSESQGRLLASRENLFSGKSGDKESRAKLTLYGNLFYLLQTHPDYLARLMMLLNKTQGASFNAFLEGTVMALYGYAQNEREEYMLLNLIKLSIKYEVDDISSVDEYWKVNPFFVKLILHYTRGAKERRFLGDLLRPLIHDILAIPYLDLETDPVGIYKMLIQQEESKTGEKSKRSYNATAKDALKDEETRDVYVKHLQKLKELTQRFLDAIVRSLDKMPFGIRFIAKELKGALEKKFGSSAEITKIIGNLLYYRYMNPAICAPEAFDVVEGVVDPNQRKNLAEIAKLLHMMSTGRLVGDDNPWLLPLNEYIKASSGRFAAFFVDACSVMPAEDYYKIDEFRDMATTHKPVIYISPREIFQIQRTLTDYIHDVAGKTEDPLALILSELGPAPSVSDADTGKNTISLQLVNRFAPTANEQEKALNKLWLDAKRKIALIVRIQSGRDLVDLLEKPTGTLEESKWRSLWLQEKELARTQTVFEHKLQKQAQETAREARRKGSEATPGTSNENLPNASQSSLSKNRRGSKSKLDMTKSQSGDIRNSQSDVFRANASKEQFLGSQARDVNGSGSVNGSTEVMAGLTFAALKEAALRDIQRLADAGRCSKANNYQALLNEIAKDILNKHRRRAQRRLELERARETLAVLEAKGKYLSEQIKSFQDYINACMKQLSSKKGRNVKRPKLFTKQFWHMRDLQKQGAVPQFGSFKYSAEDLKQKGVLVELDGISPKQFGQVTLVLSSDEPGVFKVDATLLGVKVAEQMELRLDDLLQDQYDGIQVITLFEVARVNLNLLLFLINKKFYA
ncbi:hypothetical protein M427DRAFT_134567 [Gonapodya prolifera JEL478]|uniref:Uncharacterized protein n=1 Tax=Gonapodya prolifera (strain JEL478) TaxID=1344416 RepID=A0A139AH49_GONPJ|nr:hypothetical protein M427DRAFT_134567 [Gonapodya prolifera JEL478]|eukprot:KXS16126.1 hypothetical protein M427DRAFT_134567 [Gonapodya prolifera JEL478]